jgi:hypothetical protein
MNAVVPYGEIEKMALAISKSGLFGVKTPEQAIAIMLVAQAEGRHPALAARDYDVIQGRPSKKSEAMLRDFLESHGKVEWHKLDDAVADATFSHPSGGSVRIVWDMRRAQAAGLGAKDMWRKYPRQMLRARCVSEGIRTVCPMATSGMYVPEEVQDFAQEKNITPTAGAGDSLSEEQKQKIHDLAGVMGKWITQGSVADAWIEMDQANLESDEKIYLWTMFDSKARAALKKEGAAQKAKHAVIEAPTETVVELISDAQKKRLEARIAELGAKRDAVKEYCLQKWNVTTFGDLNKQQYQQLDEILPTLAAAESAQAASPPSDGAAPSTAQQPEADLYVSAEQAAELETLCADNGLVGKFKEQAQVEKFSQVLAADFDSAKKWIAKKLAPRNEAQI